MKNEEAKKKINKEFFKIRCLWGGLALLFLILAITFTVLYKNSEEIIYTEISGIQHKNITYNYDYIYPMVFGWFGAVFCGGALLVSAFCFKIKSVSIEDDDIMLRIGVAKNELYINGESCDEIVTRFNKGYLEGKLSDGSTITVSGLHVSFSNGRDAIDL